MDSMENDKTGWKQDPEGVRQNILEVATRIFARDGLSGTRIDEIAAQTRTSKRMIYYYFGDKERLYVKVLEAAYAKVRKGEVALDLADLPPSEALMRLVSFTFDHHRAHPDFIRLVMVENVHQAGHLRQSEVTKNLNTTAIAQLAEILRRGEETGEFRAGLDPVALHWKISALSFFNVSNRPTFSALFGDTLYDEAGQQRLRDDIASMVLVSVRKFP